MRIAKTICILLVILVAFWVVYYPANCKSEQPLQIKVASFNLRGYNSADKEERNWEHRKYLVVEFFQKSNLDFCGLQETDYWQFPDFLKFLGDYVFLVEARLGAMMGV